ncbi:hypothetical protein Scep_017416 [Stephania cephalantha]|uniref:Uncharacterized protein n=1 Tax=Stephania cephalantha TaxID=152367 RepID=A0AAP0IPG1_9MAGN
MVVEAEVEVEDEDETVPDQGRDRHLHRPRIGHMFSREQSLVIDVVRRDISVESVHSQRQ